MRFCCLRKKKNNNSVARGAGPFYFPDGKARFNVADYRAPIDDASEDYPIYLTTGRVVSQFLSGTQTRRIGPLVKQYAEPRIELHPRLAGKLGIADGEWATCETRRGADFTLLSDQRKPVTLSSFRGKQNVVLAFFPWAFTSTCTAELCDFGNDVPQFSAADTIVFGVSYKPTFA